MEFEDQKDIHAILSIANQLARHYLEKSESKDIKVLKEKVRDFLTDPLWSDNSIHQLRKKVLEMKKDSDLNESLMQEINKTIDLQYSKFFQKEYKFEGKVREYEKKLINLLNKAGKSKGLKPVYIALIGYLLIHENGLTQQQLKELSGFSIGSVSTTLNTLEGLGAIKKNLIKGKRTYIYSFGGNISEITSNIGVLKREINDNATDFIQLKINELREIFDESKLGYNIIMRRMTDMVNFLEIRRKIIKKIEIEFKKKLNERE
jgi:DNA-binding transcriptional regulator GbsR (MarR family)